MFLPLILACAAAQTTVVLNPVDSESIASVSGEDFNDNILRAYWNNSSQGYVDGLMKFDLSSLPNKSAIVGMSLRLYHQASNGSPFANPKVLVFRSLGDTWATGQNDWHPGVSQPMNVPQTGFPTTDLTAVDFPLPLFNTINWSTDIIDNILTMGIRNTAGASGSFSYVYFYGHAQSPAPPELTITYTSDPGLSVYNLRNNIDAIFTVYNAKPHANVGVFLSKTGPGPAVINAGPCGPTSFNLSNRIFTLGVKLTNSTGEAVITYLIPPPAAGLTVWIQAADFGTCKLSALFTGVVG
jgi:hypothetical protein